MRIKIAGQMVQPRLPHLGSCHHRSSSRYDQGGPHARPLKPEEVQSRTFSITNFGSNGALVDQFLSKVEQVLEGWSEEVL